MNGAKYLLDTNVIISALNRGLSLPAAQYFVSVISEIELLSFPSITAQEEAQIHKMLNSMILVELTSRIKKETIFLRRQKKLKRPDALICASAICEGATLVTNDLQLHATDSCKVRKLEDLLNTDSR